jgi:mono/diheme cytochrome c family protein
MEQEKAMGRYRWIPALAGLALLGCVVGEKSAHGFRLPDGDPAHGRQVFLDLKCNACHEVAGEDLPGPVADPPLGFELGGVVTSVKTDGELVTAIVDPSHRLVAASPPDRVASGGLSRMGDFSEAMTVRDLIDVVAYLHTRYEVVSPSSIGP